MVNLVQRWDGQPCRRESSSIIRSKVCGWDCVHTCKHIYMSGYCWYYYCCNRQKFANLGRVFVTADRQPGSKSCTQNSVHVLIHTAAVSAVYAGTSASTYLPVQQQYSSSIIIVSTELDDNTHTQSRCRRDVDYYIRSISCDW